MRAQPWLGVAGAAALAVLNLLNLAAGAYAEYAERHLDQPAGDRTLAASHNAATLTPWSARRTALEGWILAERRRGEESQAAYTTALAAAPADSILWSEYAMALARTGLYRALDVPTERACALAPASPAVQGASAAMALSYWEHGAAPVRAAWMQSLRYELNHDRQPFLRSVITHGRALMFCDQLAPALGEDAWCADLRRRIDDCRSQQPQPADDILCILSD